MSKTVTAEQWQELYSEFVIISKRTGLSVKCVISEVVGYLKEAERYACAEGITLAEASRYFEESGKLKAFHTKLWQTPEEAMV